MEITEEIALQILERGVVAVPTETVYGLAARLHSEEAIEELFRLKGRPRQNPLIIHVSSLEMAYNYIEEPPPHFEKLATRFWPGPLSLVIQAKNVPKIATGGLDTACFRMPAYLPLLALIEKAGPLVIPSANLSGSPSSTKRAHVEADFGAAFPIFTSGEEPCIQGLESTVLFFHEGIYKIVRPGMLIPEDFLSTLGYLPPFHKNEKEILCPGSHFKHYSPKAKLLTAGDAEAVLGFSEREYPLPVVHIGSLSSAEITAARLFDALREVDQRGYRKVLVDLDFPKNGLWKTIDERLLRAIN